VSPLLNQLARFLDLALQAANKLALFVNLGAQILNAPVAVLYLILQFAYAIAFSLCHARFPSLSILSHFQHTENEDSCGFLRFEIGEKSESPIITRLSDLQREQRRNFFLLTPRQRAILLGKRAAPKPVNTAKPRTRKNFLSLVRRTV
jgi:hypothetical protein